MLPRVIHIQPEAPPKPALGEPCNGCGVCCLAAPCPLGVLLSRSRQGACRALQWECAQDAQTALYRCGAMSAPDKVLNQALPTWTPPAVVAWLARHLPRLARRWIASGVGCDCSLETITSCAPEPN